MIWSENERVFIQLKDQKGHLTGLHKIISVFFFLKKEKIRITPAQRHRYFHYGAETQKDVQQNAKMGKKHEDAVIQFDYACFEIHLKAF